MDVTTFTVTGLTNGTEYTVEVAAENSVGVGPFATSTATPAALPGAPQNLTVASAGDSLMVAWSAPTSDGGSAVTTYRLRWKESGANDFGAADVATVAADTVTYTITELVNGATYAVEVAAENSVGIGDYAAATAILFHLDVDDDDKVTARDAILIARFLLGVPAGGGLTDGVADESDSDKIAARIQAGKDGLALDLDGDKDADCVDGILLARYLLGLRGGALRGDFSVDADAVAARAAALQ